jgi:hypothetical protein
MPCLECGFEFDEANESQPVCPRCGADSNGHPRSALDPELLFPGMTADEIREAARPDPVITPGNNLIN